MDSAGVLRQGVIIKKQKNILVIIFCDTGIINAPKMKSRKLMKLNSLRIYSVNVTKFAVSCRFGQYYEEILNTRNNICGMTRAHSDTKHQNKKSEEN